MQLPRFTILLNVLISLLTGFSAFAQNLSFEPSELLHKTHAERTLTLTSYYNQGLRYDDSISIFSTIDEVAFLAREHDDYELYLESELMRVHYYNYRLKFPMEQVVSKIDSLDAIAKAKGILWLEIRTQSLLANYLYYFHNEYARGFEHFERTVLLLEGITGEAFPLKQICLYQVAMVYFEFREYNEAIKYLYEAMGTKSGLNSHYYNMHFPNTMAISYRNLGQLDSAEHYLNITLDSALVSKDSVWMALTYGNLGQIEFLKKNYDSAIQFSSKKLELAKQLKRGDLEAPATVTLGLYYFENRDINKAKKLADLSKQARFLLHTTGHLKQYYSLQSKLAYQLGELSAGGVYLDSMVAIIDSMYSQFNGIQLMRAKQQVLLEKHKHELETRMQKHQERVWLRNGIIGALAFTVVLILLLYNRNRLKAKNREQTILAEKLAAEKELEYASGKLEDFKNSIHQRNMLIEQIEHQLEAANIQVQNLQHPDQTAQKAIINQLQETAILTDKDWREFVQLFEKVNSGFFERLDAKFPDLTPAETRLMALSRLQLGNKEMALMLGVGTGAIRQNKSRLRKKIGLDEKVDLEDLSSDI